MKEKVFDGDFYRKLESISIKARMIMTEGAAGGRKSKAKGSSVEFSDFREYSPGDDFRRIDWNAYGRFDKLYFIISSLVIFVFAAEKCIFVRLFELFKL